MARTSKATQPAPAQGAGTKADERSAHHPFGPSRWPALMECPCWEGKPADTDAERGTHLHAVFEAALTGVKKDPEDAFEANVIRAADEIRAMAVKPVRWWIEERVCIYTPGGTKTPIFGRMDVAWLEAEGDLHVVDLKMVENPERNYRPQLLGYAFGIIGSGASPGTIHLHMAYADSGKVTHESLPVAEAWTEYAEIYRRIDAIMVAAEPLAPVQCGWCNLCAKFAECKAPRAVAEKVSEQLASVPEHWADFNPARKAQYCVLAEAVAKWSAAVKERAAEDAKAGLPIEDPDNGIFYGVQERQGRLVLGTEQTWGAVKPIIPADRFRQCLDVSATRLTAVLKEHGMKPKDIKTLLEGCGTRGASSLSFVRKGVK